ncbi:MAG: MarR family winged helix-turn-helix transcriptional regulator [Sphingomonas sp.]
MTALLEFLIGDVARLLRRRFGERAKMLGATRPQWRTLTMLARHEGIAEPGLADLLEVEPAPLSRMIDRMVTSGLVRRRPSLDGGVDAQIYLTDAARPVMFELLQIADQVFEEALVGVSAQDRAVLQTALSTMRSNLAQPMAARGGKPQH